MKTEVVILEKLGSYMGNVEVEGIDSKAADIVWPNETDPWFIYHPVRVELDGMSRGE